MRARLRCRPPEVKLLCIRCSAASISIEHPYKGVQGDPSATLTDSDASIFYLWGNVTDPTYAQTNTVLAFYRLQLQNRSIQLGPPPYANCP
jgi:hypothetical protein